MTEHVFRASDTESAMDKAIRELGDDAMILSVTRVGDLTEVRAMKESLVSVAPRPVDTLARGTQVRPVSLSEALRTVDARRQGLDPDLEDTAHAPSLPSSVPLAEPVQQTPVRIDLILGDAPDSVPDDISDTSVDFAPRPPSPTGPITLAQSPAIALAEPQAQPIPAPTLAPYTPAGPEPDGDTALPKWHRTPDTTATTLPAFGAPQPEGRVPEPMPRILAQNGFAPDIVRASTALPLVGDHETQITEACALLAARLAPPQDAPSALDGDILVVFGPPGAGKTTTAARLAFERIQSSAHRPALVQMRADAFVEDSRLARHAQLLGTAIMSTTPDPEGRGDTPVIVDCSLTDPEHIIDAIDTLRRTHPETIVQPILTLPGTWSTTAITQYCTPFDRLAPAVILTQMHIGGIGVAGLTALSEHGATLLAATDSTHVSDGIAVLDTQMIAAFLREAFGPFDTTTQLGP